MQITPKTNAGKMEESIRLQIPKSGQGVFVSCIESGCVVSVPIIPEDAREERTAGENRDL